ncbi:MAG: hypothetical protein KDA52_11150 [Planctomycetaceae bacterium]|nr:hypothetical protein [Planctomycetaceae bacterium]
MAAFKANPGGTLGIGSIFGRDKLAKLAWEQLDQQSIQMTAERRIGKTSLIRKMCKEAPSGWVPVLQDLEKIHTASDFSKSVFEKVEDYLSKKEKFANKARQWLSEMGGAEVGGVFKMPKLEATSWKALLTHTIHDLVEGQYPDRLVFFWDELPYMLQGIGKRDGQDTAMEVLDVLRAIRHEHHEGFRMVVTGSIGLHHVISTLKSQGYSNEPVNDLYHLEVPPLEPEDARELARALILGEGLIVTDMTESITAIAEAADNVPFYIHHIVKHLKIHHQQKADVAAITKSVETQLRDANDPWELRHYRDRLKTYYPNDEKVALAILDAQATADAPQSVDQLFEAVKSQETFTDRDHLLDLLRMMDQDHYLKRTADGYQFRFPLIGRWWRMDRALS